jgi:prolipoprotein diacylglyceryltransferase
MALKTVHLAFMVVSAALGLFLIWWGLLADIPKETVVANSMVLLGLCLFIFLSFYIKWFRRKMRRISVIMMFLYPTLVFPCAVCFKDPDSLMTLGANSGVLFLVGVIVSILLAIAGIGIYWSKKAKNL